MLQAFEGCHSHNHWAIDRHELFPRRLVAAVLQPQNQARSSFGDGGHLLSSVLHTRRAEISYTAGEIRAAAGKSPHETASLHQRYIVKIDDRNAWLGRLLTL